MSALEIFFVSFCVAFIVENHRFKALLERVRAKVRGER